MSRPPTTPKRAGRTKTLLVWVASIVVFLALFQLTREDPGSYVDFARFIENADAGRVGAIRVMDNEIRVEGRDGSRYWTLGVVDDAMVQRLSESGARVAWGEEKSPMRTLLITGVPLLLVIALFLFLLRKATVGAGGFNWMEIKKSRARLLPDEAKVRFEDVGGCEQAKARLGDVVDFLKHPERWTGAGVRLPRGVLLEGPPGCGKTLLARAIAGETDAKFYAVAGSEFVELFVGMGATRMRDTFEIAAKEAPAVVFIDELDAIGRRRGSGIGPAHEEREQTLNQLLVNMDGFAHSDRVVVIAATNRPDILDSALVRPGRFDRRIQVPELDAEQRADVLRIHTRDKRLAEDVDFGELARRSEGWSGARLESWVNEAGLLAVRRARDEDGEVRVAKRDFDLAMQEARSGGHESGFDHVDALLMESTSQLAQATGRAAVRLTLAEGGVVEGTLLWADALFLKLHNHASGEPMLVSKAGIKTIEALEGTEPAAAGDVAPDRWAGRDLDVA